MAASFNSKRDTSKRPSSPRSPSKRSPAKRARQTLSTKSANLPSRTSADDAETGRHDLSPRDRVSPGPSASVDEDGDFFPSALRRSLDRVDLRLAESIVALQNEFDARHQAKVFKKLPDLPGIASRCLGIPLEDVKLSLIVRHYHEKCAPELEELYYPIYDALDDMWSNPRWLPIFARIFECARPDIEELEQLRDPENPDEIWQIATPREFAVVRDWVVGGIPAHEMDGLLAEYPDIVGTRALLEQEDMSMYDFHWAQHALELGPEFDEIMA